MAFSNYLLHYSNFSYLTIKLWLVLNMKCNSVSNAVFQMYVLPLYIIQPLFGISVRSMVCSSSVSSERINYSPQSKMGFKNEDSSAVNASILLSNGRDTTQFYSSVTIIAVFALLSLKFPPFRLLSFLPSSHLF